MPIGEVVARGQSSFAIVANRPAFSVYVKELIDMNKEEEESKQNVDYFVLKCSNGVVFVHKEMASLLKMPTEVFVSREATLLALRICYGELVDNDVIAWLHSLKIEFGQLLNLMTEIYNINFGLGNQLKIAVDALSLNLNYITAQEEEAEKMLSAMFNERYQLNNKCASADIEPFEYPEVTQQQAHAGGR